MKPAASSSDVGLRTPVRAYFENESSTSTSSKFLPSDKSSPLTFVYLNILS
jgi:hypothetical protein